MNVPERLDESVLQKRRLPRRDWVLLPALCLVTLGLLAVAAKLGNHLLYKVSQSRSSDCLVITDPITGVRGIPHCRCFDKAFEGDLVEYRFNSCGDRSEIACESKPQGMYRIVLLGSSIAEGMHVSWQGSIASLLAGDLSEQTRHAIDVYSKGLQWNSPFTVAKRFQRHDIQAVHPDIALWLVTPWDIMNPDLLLPATTGTAPTTTVSHSPSALFERTEESAAGFFAHGNIVKHYLFLDQNLLVQRYLTQGADIDFLRTSTTPAFSKNLKDFDTAVTLAMSEANAAEIPVVFCVLPARGQAAMISVGHWPAEYDPYRLGKEVRSIAERHGATYVDVLHSFSNISNPERNYLPVDGHPTPEGYKLLSELLANALLQAHDLRPTTR